ncbi:MAG: OmpA/MotB family protein [Oligoflexus sp.]
MRRVNSHSRSIQKKAANHEGTWAVSYGDMITLLLAFFILFFSVAPPEDDKTLFSDALVATFMALDQERGTAAQQNPKFQVIEEKLTHDDAVKTDVNAPNSAADNKLANLLLSLGKGLGIIPEVEQTSTSASSTNLSETISPSAKDAKIEVKAIGAEMQTINNKIIITFPEVSFFHSASTDLTPQGTEVLKKFTETYLPFAGKNRVNIVGFADPRPVLSQYRFRDNLELSVLRAVSAQRILEQWGIPLARTRLMGHGVKHHLEANEKPDSENQKLALSRKIMLIIEPEEERS